MVTSAEDVMCDTLLPIKTSTDEWKTAQPLTKSTKLQYPFGITRPNHEEVRMQCCVLMKWIVLHCQ